MDLGPRLLCRLVKNDVRLKARGDSRNQVFRSLLRRIYPDFPVLFFDGPTSRGCKNDPAIGQTHESRFFRKRNGKTQEKDEDGTMEHISVSNVRHYSQPKVARHVRKQMA